MPMPARAPTAPAWLAPAPALAPVFPDRRVGRVGRFWGLTPNFAQAERLRRQHLLQLLPLYSV